MSVLLLLVCLALLVLFFLIRLQCCVQSHRLPLPPGPAGRFLLGNLGQISPSQPDQDYLRWGLQYNSDVVHVQVLGRHMICLNSLEAANDLLEKRGANYCDRPRFTLFEIMGWGHTLTFLQCGPRLDRHRALFNYFGESKIRQFQQLQVAEARRAMFSLLQDPTGWKDIALLYTTSIIFRIAYGHEVSDQESPYCKMAAEANKATTNGGIAGSSIVDIFPLARYVPPFLNFSKPLQHARRSKKVIQTIHEVPWNDNMAELEAGTAEPSFMRTHWQEYQDKMEKGIPQHLTIADLKGATAAVFIAGGNSTWGMILTCLLFLTKYPTQVKRIQKEIDDVIHGERLPDFGDRPKLSSLNRFVKEVQRVLPANPLCIPHRSVKDDVYKGMFIPAGSIIFANTKAMSSNPAVYRDPEVFNPDRYAEPCNEPFPTGNFGFGRRKCPGNHLAMASVYIFLTTLLATFDIEKVIGPDGLPVEPEAKLSIGLGG